MFPRAIKIGLLHLFLLCQQAEATWYSENVENGADMIMMDLRWPWWPSGTYYANWNSSFNPKPNNVTFYAGFTATVPDAAGSLPNPDENLQRAFQPGSVWSFWGGDATGAPVKFIESAPNLFLKNIYGGEGLSATLGGESWPFIKSQRWFTMLARVWQPVPGEGQALVGRWIKDQASREWHLIALASLPIPATSFTGNSGFIEPLTSEKAVRSLHRRFGYFRKDGRWQSGNSISIDKTEYVIVNTVTEDDHEFAAIEYAQRPDLLPQKLTGKPLAGDQKHTFTVRQPSTPTLDKPMVNDVSAQTNGSQIAVTWSVPPTSAPTLGYKIEVFDNPACTGAAKIVHEARMPTQREALIASTLATPVVRFTLTDVFDQTTAPIIVTAKVLPPPRKVPEAKAALPGLTYELFHKDTKRIVNYFDSPILKPNEQHHWLHLEEIAQGKLVRQGLARGFDIGVREQRDAGYALVFKGLLRVPADGLYIFHAQIDGGYRLEIDEVPTLLWDGQYGSTQRAAVQHLAQGEHAISLTYLYDALPGHNFRVEWEGPNLPRQEIGLQALSTNNAQDYPSPALQATALGDGTANVSVMVTANGHAVQRTVLFLGPLELAASDGPALKYSGPLPANTNTLWARVRFDGNHTVDSAPVSLQVTGKPVDAPWSVRNVGDNQASAGLWQTGAHSFRFFGNGMHTVTQKLTGDFTATCRIDDYNGSKGEPVNRRAWVGLTAREHGEKRNWSWGQDFHLVQTAGDGLRASADFTDFGAGRISSYELPKGRPWLRIMREGNIWTAWSSVDGKAWELGAYQFRKAAPDMDLGLFFSALPQEARAQYHASVSEFTIRPGISSDSTPPAPAVAQHTAGDRLTGVVIARSDAKIVVLRSTARGLMRTTDGGKTWTPANGDLAGDDLAVRSVGIHPHHPSIMLRASGRGPLGSLWRTADGGQHWVKLDFTGDFDGVGPSALCGEIIAFDLKNPDIIYLGCESAGFFKSSDSGTTWKQLGVAGERITAITVWPWEKHYPAPAKGRTHLCVTTCPDRWMELLGRGPANVSTAVQLAHGYVSHDGVQTLTVADERLDTGFYNVAFDKAMQSVNEMRYGTAHGYQTQVFQGSQMALYPPQKHLEWFRPTTAVAAAAMGDKKFGRFLTQALDPEVPGRLSRSEVWAFEWQWLPIQGTIPQGGLIAVAGDQTLGEQWWLVFTDGLYYSADGGTHLSKVLAANGDKL